MVKNEYAHFLDQVLDDPWVTSIEEVGAVGDLTGVTRQVGDFCDGMGGGGRSVIGPQGRSLRLCRVAGSCLSWLRELGVEDPRQTVRTRCDDLALEGVDVTLGGSMTETKRLGALVMVLGDVASVSAAGLPVREVVSDVARLAVVAASWALRLDEDAPWNPRWVSHAPGEVAS